MRWLAVVVTFLPNASNCLVYAQCQSSVRKPKWMVRVIIMYRQARSQDGTLIVIETSNRPARRRMTTGMLACHQIWPCNIERAVHSDKKTTIGVFFVSRELFIEVTRTLHMLFMCSLLDDGTCRR